MATLITRTQVRQEMLRRVPVLGRALTADSIGANSLTHKAEYYRNRAGPTEYENQIVHRYNLQDPDRWRRILSLNSPSTDGIVNVDGPVYVDQVDTAYERLGIHPDDINAAIAEGQRRQRVRSNIALTRADLDLDMETAGVLQWDGTSGGSKNNATVTKVASAASVETGTQALSIVGTGAGAYCRSSYIGVIPGQLVYVACYIYGALTANQTFRLRDGINGVYFGDTRTVPVTGRYLMSWILATVPTNCSAIQIEFAPVNGGTMFVDTCFGPYQPGQTVFNNPPTALNEAYKLRFVRPVHYQTPLSTAGFFNAESVVFEGDLTTPENWALEAFRRDQFANRLRLIPSTLYPHPPAMGLDGGFCPLFLALEAKVSDYEPLLTEASTTSQPLDECACYSLRYLFENLADRTKEQRWKDKMQEYARWAVIEDIARPPQPRMPPARLHQVNA